MKYIIDDFFTKKTFWLHVFVPIMLGSLIYVFLREDNILIFQIFKFIGIYDMIDALRTYTMEWRSFIPEWIYYSLPDGLWVYSLNVFCLFFTGYYIDSKTFIFPFVGIFLGVGSEVFQYLKIIPGTFDILDLVVCLIGVIAAFILYKLRKKEYLKEYNDSLKVNNNINNIEI